MTIEQLLAEILKELKELNRKLDKVLKGEKRK